jgi:prepilin-type N-terminal cleavage/methylation domain-containing protein
MIISRTRHCDAGRKGFTLAEAMMATVVLGIAATGVLLPFTSGAAVRAEGMRRTLGAKLASDLMEEIVNTPFEEIVIGYYSEAQGQIRDASGVVFTDSNYANLSRDSSCAYAYVPQESWSGAFKFILVTVRVYYRGKEIATINRLISE